MWARFMDMHSGGEQKLDWGYIYIEADEKTADRVFYAKLGRSPNHTTCDTCGGDYSESESSTLAEITGYERNCPSIVADKNTQDDQGCYPSPPDKRWYYEPGEEPPPGWHIRSNGYGRYQTVEEYVKSPAVKVIYASEITDEERRTELPEIEYDEDY